MDRLGLRQPGLGQGHLGLGLGALVLPGRGIHHRQALPRAGEAGAGRLHLGGGQVQVLAAAELFGRQALLAGQFLLRPQEQGLGLAHRRGGLGPLRGQGTVEQALQGRPGDGQIGLRRLDPRQMVGVLQGCHHLARFDGVPCLQVDIRQPPGHGRGDADLLRDGLHPPQGGDAGAGDRDGQAAGPRGLRGSHHPSQDQGHGDGHEERGG